MLKLKKVRTKYNSKNFLIGSERFVILCLKKTKIQSLESEVSGGEKTMIESFTKEKSIKNYKIEAFLFFKKGSLYSSSTYSKERFTTNITDTNMIDHTLTQEDLKNSGV